MAVGLGRWLGDGYDMLQSNGVEARGLGYRSQELICAESSHPQPMAIQMR